MYKAPPVGKDKLEEEVALPQGLGRNVDAQVLVTNLEDEVGGKQTLKRPMEAKVGPTNLNDEVGWVDGNRIREGEVKNHMVEEETLH